MLIHSPSYGPVVAYEKNESNERLVHQLKVHQPVLCIPLSFDLVFSINRLALHYINVNYYQVESGCVCVCPCFALEQLSSRAGRLTRVDPQL